MINPTKLHRELVEAGIPIEGVAATEPPRIDFLPEATQAQRDHADQIVVAHIPEDVEDQRQKAYLEEGITTEELIVALWEQIVEGRPEKAVALQDRRVAIKQRYPKPNA